MLPDDVPMLLPHGAKHSRALREVRRRLREYLSEQAEKGQDVPMMRTDSRPPPDRPMDDRVRRVAGVDANS